MTDLSRTPLTLEQIQLLAMLRVPVHVDDNGQTFVLRRYWNGITEALRHALAKAVS
jgi:hypothetical protein